MTIKAVTAKPSGFRTIYQVIKAGDFRGKRVRAWADDLKLEVVDATAPTTGLRQARVDLMNRPERLKRTPQWGEGAPAQSALPVNPDFER